MSREILPGCSSSLDRQRLFTLNQHRRVRELDRQYEALLNGRYCQKGDARKICWNDVKIRFHEEHAFRNEGM